MPHFELLAGDFDAVMARWTGVLAEIDLIAPPVLVWYCSYPGVSGATGPPQPRSHSQIPRTCIVDAVFFLFYTIFPLRSRAARLLFFGSTVFF